MRTLRWPLLRTLPLAVAAQALVVPGWAQTARLLPQIHDSVAINRPAASAEPQLRVLLQQAAEIRLEASGAPLQLRGADGSDLGVLAPGQGLQVALDPANPNALLLAATQPQLQPASAPAALDGRVAGDLWLEPITPEALIRLQQRAYRGRLQLRLEDGKLLAINHVPLETYLPSVVGSEMPASWPQPALRAQAVAARTYALRQRQPAASFDLTATVASQVYKGVDSETESTREAVMATRGLVLTYGGELIEAVFHSSSGGSTEASGDVWAQQLPYLQAVPDFDDHSPVRSWDERFEPDQLRQVFVETGGISKLEISSRTSGGRVRQVRIEGPQGSLVLSGAQLRKRLGLRSTWIEHVELQGLAAAEVTQPLSLPLQFSEPLPLTLPPLPALQPGQRAADPALQAPLLIRGRGFGHGVGMSQWGAHGLARRGASFGTILSHYYPGTQLDAYRAP